MNLSPGRAINSKCLKFAYGDRLFSRRGGS
jgi:hypothetical protein